MGFVLFCLESCCLQKYGPILGYPATCKKSMGKCTIFFTFLHFFALVFNFLSRKYIYILDYKFDSNGPYYCRVLNSEQNETNSMSLGPKMREELSVK